MSAHGGSGASLPVPASDSEEFDRDNDVLVGMLVIRMRVHPSRLKPLQCVQATRKLMLLRKVLNDGVLMPMESCRLGPDEGRWHQILHRRAAQR